MHAGQIRGEKFQSISYCQHNGITIASKKHWAPGSHSWVLTSSFNVASLKASLISKLAEWTSFQAPSSPFPSTAQRGSCSWWLSFTFSRAATSSWWRHSSSPSRSECLLVPLCFGAYDIFMSKQFQFDSQSCAFVRFQYFLLPSPSLGNDNLPGVSKRN